MAGDPASELARGGMRTKIEAGKIATTAGTHMVIASGRVDHPLQAIADGAPCTWFLTPANPVTARKKWIAGSLEPRGALTIDAGAVQRAALGQEPAAGRRRSRSRAPSSAAMRCVVRGPDGAEIGRGLIAYDAADADKIKGRSSADILLDPRLRRPQRDDPPRRSGAGRGMSCRLRAWLRHLHDLSHFRSHFEEPCESAALSLHDATRHSGRRLTDRP